MNLPNKLTIGRVIAVPFFIVAYMLQYYWVALALFVLASITDTLDGKIARRKGLITNFGKIMDPLADKVLVYSAFCLFVADGIMPAWVLVIILAREFAVAGMRTVAASEGTVVAADMAGKIKTVLQMICVPAFLITIALAHRVVTVNGGFSGTFEPGEIFHILSHFAIEIQVLAYISIVSMYAALAMTIWSGISYLKNNKGVFRQ